MEVAETIEYKFAKGKTAEENIAAMQKFYAAIETITLSEQADIEFGASAKQHSDDSATITLELGSWAKEKPALAAEFKTATNKLAAENGSETVVPTPPKAPTVPVAKMVRPAAPAAATVAKDTTPIPPLEPTDSSMAKTEKITERAKPREPIQPSTPPQPQGFGATLKLGEKPDGDTKKIGTIEVGGEGGQTPG